eukprot:CAMPEP_0180337204 /NCGR_PEP_ID=MMETSP0988-20121125/45257_1 /TAXON_ID=697907 /ORGANISM="non described non described, Strain CCMP2293" /LENGTH=407 /DNA_ID=CAMNT_0022325533 /DNA_START=88 /DNA_END=1312 /DNA_ORIENTATION=+
MALALDQVRKIASEERLKETFFNETSRVVSFAPDSPGNARINVYYSTGTVGKCLLHDGDGRDVPRPSAAGQDAALPAEGRPRDAPRDFPQPARAHGQGVPAAPAPAAERLCPGGASRAGGAGDEEAEARAQLQKLQNEAKDIAVDIANVQAIVRGFERKREEGAAALKQRRRQEQEARDADEQRRKAKEADAQLERKRSARGRQLAFQGLPGRDAITGNFSEDVVSVATDGEATIMLFEQAAWAFTAGLPTALHNKLQGRQRTLPRPTYVALGSENRYYLEFADGAKIWSGPEALRRALEDEDLIEQHRGVRTVAFGETFDAFFLVCKDGWWSCGGELPDGLEEGVRRKDLSCVSLGPDGEWYFQAHNGSSKWGGVPRDFANFIRKVKSGITFIDFGADGSYLIRYN